jgi:hypothetical protein
MTGLPLQGVFLRRWTMIILEFRSQEIFQKASAILKNNKLSCISELSSEEWQPSSIFMFEDAVRSDSQREVLRQARALEKEDQQQRKIHQELNLAVPL